MRGLHTLPSVLRLASSLNTTATGTVSCPRDALYTSLVDVGVGFCSRVVEAGHCGGGYWTPTQFASVNQTRIASYCECIVATVTGNGTVTTTGQVSTETESSAETDAPTETRGSPARRPGPGNPSGSEPASTATGSMASTGSGNWTIGEPTATTLESTGSGVGNGTVGEPTATTLESTGLNNGTITSTSVSGDSSTGEAILTSFNSTGSGNGTAATTLEPTRSGDFTIGEPTATTLELTGSNNGTIATTLGSGRSSTGETTFTSFNSTGLSSATIGEPTATTLESTGPSNGTIAESPATTLRSTGSNNGTVTTTLGLSTREPTVTSLESTGSNNGTIGEPTATTFEPTGSGNFTIGEPTATTLGSTGTGNWTIGESTATTLDPSSGTSEQSSTETLAGRPGSGDPSASGSESTTETSDSVTGTRSTSAGSGLSRPTLSGSSTFGGWNSSMTVSAGSGTLTGSVTWIGTWTARTGTGTFSSGNNTFSLSETSSFGDSSRTGSDVSATDSRSASTVISGSGTFTTSGIISNTTSRGNRTSSLSGSSASSDGSRTGAGVSATETQSGATLISGGDTATGTAALTNTTSNTASFSGTLTGAPILSRPTAFPNGTSPVTGNATSPTVSEIPVANFTRVTRTAYVSQETCFTFPQDPENDPSRRAVLHNSKLREQNATIPPLYIESVDFESGGIDPLYLTLRDTEEGSHYLDISNKSHIAIVDGYGYSMVMDFNGIHFSTNSCTYDVHITIRDLYKQLASLAGVECSVGGRQKRMDSLDFEQILNLHDQCGNPIDRSLRPYPQLSVGDTVCTNTDVDEVTGEWTFDCTFPGSQSGSMKCQWAIKNDIVDFLLRDPFGGSCPDLSTVVTTLSETGRDFMSAESLRTELYNQGLDDYEKLEADAAVTAYENLWRVLQESFVKNKTQPAGNDSALEQYINLYNTYRSLEDDICEDLHAGELPLPLTLTAGTATIPPITTLNWAPTSPRTYNLTIQDPSTIACCADGRVADTTGRRCAYPADAVISAGCLCGRTADGRSIGFEVTECDNYVARCESDGECGEKGFGGFVCLVGTCCEGGVCVDPFACSQNGTQLI